MIRLFLLLLSIAALILTVLFMPKKITWLEIVSNGWFSVAFAYTADVYLDLKYELYAYFAIGTPDWQTLLILFGLYPTFNAVYLNFIPKSNWWRRGLYILICTCLLVLYEWSMVHLHVLHYTGWKLYYSALSYPVILLILYGNYRFTKTFAGKGENARVSKKSHPITSGSL